MIGNFLNLKIIMLVLATKNKFKVTELSLVLKGLAWSQAPSAFDCQEGHSSLMGNALAKAQEARKFASDQDICLGEDTGLFVDALKGEPGVLSSRYAGEGVSFEENIKKLLKSLEGVEAPRRSARFLTVAILVFPNGKIVIACGRLDGEILTNRQGSQGFGYDPIFYVPQLNKTLAELTIEEKTKISHRSRAIEALRPYLEAGG